MIDRLRYLLAKRAKNTLDEGEQRQLDELLLNKEDDQVIEAIELLINESETMPVTALSKEGKLEIFQKVVSVDKINRIHFQRTAWFRYAAAAVVVLFVTGTYFFLSDKKPAQPLANDHKPVQTEIAPGGDKAILTLADGKKIALDSAANGALAQQGNARVVKLANGQLAYTSETRAREEGMMNTLATPNGGQYHLRLPDGTNVWLNAASAITYPVSFSGIERHVKITGEAYFEVAKNKAQPFTVDVNGKSAVEVLGTSFNINAYENETMVRTTLVEGSVKAKAGDKEVTLHPGQQAAIGKNASIKLISDPDMEQILAWKNGLFNFNQLSANAVLRQLERWYDIKVQYQGALPDITFRGEMYRNVNLSAVLDVLKEMGIKFKLEGKTLIVTN